MKRLVDFLIDERTVVAAILLNTAALFAYGFTGQGHPWSPTLLWIDFACILYFVAEAIAKIRRWGWATYWGSWWNRFDLIVVVSSLPELLAPWFGETGFAAFVLFRAGRLFRLFRLMHFIPDRDHLAMGIVRSLKASVGLFLALILVNFVLAMGATLLFGTIAPELFGDPIISIYSMFKVFTVEGWYEIGDAVAAGSGSTAMSFLARGYFVGCVLLGGILGLSLANAVFVDQMMLDNNDELEERISQLSTDIERLSNKELEARVAQLNDSITNLGDELKTIKELLSKKP